MNKTTVLFLFISSLVLFSCSQYSHKKWEIPYRNMFYLTNLEKAVSLDSVYSLQLFCDDSISCQKAKIVLENIDKYKNLKRLGIAINEHDKIASKFNVDSISVPINTLKMCWSFSFSEGIKKLPGWVLEYPNVRMLYLGNNSIESIPKEILNLKKLKTLTIVCDRDYWEYDYKQRKYIDFKAVKIFEIPDWFQKMRTIEELRFEFFNFKDLKNDFVKLSKLPKLKILDLVDCNLRTLPEEIGLLKNLEELHLQSESGSEGNYFTTLPEGIKHLKKLKNLTLPYIDLLKRDSIENNLPANCKIDYYESCFPANAKILLSNHDKVSIDNIKINDQLLSYNFASNSFDTSTVLKIVMHDERLYDLWKIDCEVPVLTASKENFFASVHSIIATPNHPLMLSSGEPKKISELNIHDKIQFFDDFSNSVIEVSIKNICRNFAQTPKVYNLLTSKENYFVDKICVGRK